MKNKNQVLIGIHPAIEAILAGKEINKILIKKGLKSDQATELLQLIRQHGIPYQYVPIEKLNYITGKNHQGVIVQLSVIEYVSLEEVVQGVFENGRDPFILVLDQLTDVRNFGAIARTAECAGVDAIVIPSKGSVAITEDAIKASAGALNIVAVCRSNDLALSVKYLKESGMQVFASTEKAGSYYYSASLTGPIVIIMGSEERGVSNNLLELADNQLKIPMFGKLESLNVGVACGIIAFEVLRQRNVHV